MWQGKTLAESLVGRMEEQLRKAQSEVRERHEEVGNVQEMHQKDAERLSQYAEQLQEVSTVTVLC